MKLPRISYACFDAFPSSKGAATHIWHTCSALSDIADRVDVYCLTGAREKPNLDENVDVHQFYFDDNQGNYLKKATLFSEKIFQCMEAVSQGGIGQFRDIWSGLGMINLPNLKTIFEVNALTSLELPEKHPLLTPNLIEEIKALENRCLQACDHIVTPSHVTKNYLLKEFNIDEAKITVIPNGGDISTDKVEIDLPEKYMVYFGALQPWQGFDVLIRALKYLKDFNDFKLIICSSVKEKSLKHFKKLAENVGVSENILYYHELDKKTLHHIVRNAKMSVAPLKFGSRNITQGCCPIKVLETMACKTPLVASELPVVKELAGENAYYFWPEDDLDLSRCIRFVLNNENAARQKANAAYEVYSENFTWQHHNEKLKTVYKNLI